MLKTFKTVPVIIALSTLILLLGTYGVWRYQAYYGGKSFGTLASQGVTASLKTSDHSCSPNCNSFTNFVSLSTDVDGTESPDYDSDINVGPTMLKKATTYFQMFRIQTRLSYYFNTKDMTRSVPANLVFNLPPKVVYTPDKLAIRGNKFHFIPAKTCFAPDGTDVCAANITTELISDDDPTSTVDDHYRVSWTNIQPFNKKVSLNSSFKKYALGLGSADAYSPPPATNLLILFRLPKEIRISFLSSQASFDNVRIMRNYLAELTDNNSTYADNVNTYAYFGSANCATDSADQRRYLCYKSTVDLVVGSEKVVPMLSLLQQMDFNVVPGGVSVEGNVAAYSANQFSLSSSNAILFGGSFNKIVGGDQLSDYLNTSNLDWSVLGPKLNAIYNSGVGAAVVAASQPVATWYLNSPDKNPSNSASATTYSAPPEGKLWYLTNDAKTITFGDINFTGSGTIILDGNVTFNGNITCSEPGRLGIISTGSITFNTSNVGCGAYLALGNKMGGGNITFTKTTTGYVKGMFVAKQNVTLPDMNDGELLTIKYDTKFSNDPTVLFSEILKVLDVTTDS